MPESLADATAAAEAEQRRYLELQHAALNAEPENRPSPADVLAAAKSAELAQQRVGIARRREAEAAEAARLEAMDALGAKVGELADAAATRNAEHSADLALIAATAARVRQRTESHDAAVVALREEAAALYGGREDVVQRIGQAGPWTPHQAPAALRHGDTAVRIVAGAVGQALAAAARGDTAAAGALLDGTLDVAPVPPDSVWLDTFEDRTWPVWGGRVPRSLQTMVEDGRARRLTDAETQQWLAAWRQQRP